MPLFANPLPSQEEIQKIFEYSVITGRLYPKEIRTGARTTRNFSGSQRSNGYWTVGIDGKKYEQNRIIWRLITGEDPGQDRIDHIDHDPDNNAWHNLRRITHGQNTTYSACHRDSKTQVKGVRHLPGGTYQARLYHRGKTFNLGCFSTKEEAGEAYRAKELELRGKFVNPNY